MDFRLRAETERKGVQNLREILHVVIWDSVLHHAEGGVKRVT
jgi:hypothetical protein